jgi:hypothetical protein
MDDNQKKFIPQLAIDNECFRSVFINGAESLKGSHRMGERRIFIKKKHRASSFNKDLFNEPNFGRIHLAGQYL